MPYPPYITAVQKATAQEMSKVAEQMGADFVLALGDNFYYKGVDNVDSPRFKVSQWILRREEGKENADVGRLKPARLFSANI